MGNEVKSWSLSSLKLYEQCPYKYKKAKIEKIVEPPSPALERGIAIHKLMENYLDGLIMGVPNQLSKFENELKNLKKNKAVPEEELVLDINWEPIDDPKATRPWFSKNAWYRGKIDARIRNLIIDLKTGKYYPDHVDQAELYALIFMLIDEIYEDVDVEFWYCDSGKVENWIFYREDLDETQKKWQARVDKLFNEEKWEPTVNQYCKWCFFKDQCPAQS